jgi:hypothetical protein
MALFVGHFSGTKYDTCKYPEDLFESTSVYEHVMNPDRIHNCNGCLTTYGPRAGYMGAGVSSMAGDVIAAAQENIDIDSVMSNRNVPISKCKRGKVNPINLRRVRTINLPECDDSLDAEHTKMTDPAMFYRGTPINRFYDLNKDPQEPIFWDHAINTRLEAKDNFIPDIPRPATDWNFPDNEDDRWDPCVLTYRANANCGTGCRENCERRLRTTSNRKSNTMNERKARGNVSFY